MSESLSEIIYEPFFSAGWRQDCRYQRETWRDLFHAGRECSPACPGDLKRHPIGVGDGLFYPQDR